ncbi:hypothetical protein ACE6H2_000522 [Prunus campanulata]
MCNPLLSKHVFLLVLCIAVWNLPIISARNQATLASDPPLTTVHINNNLPIALEYFTIHCQTNTEDLGVHEIACDTAYERSFRFGGVTLLTCGINFRRYPQGRLEDVFGVFDMYVADRDKSRCPTNCIWNVTEGGVYGYRDYNVGDSDISLEWPKPPPQMS